MNKRQRKKQRLKALTNLFFQINAKAVKEGRMEPITRKQAESFARGYIAAKEKKERAVIALRTELRKSIARIALGLRERINEERDDR